jgi:hypothetical protein
VKPGLFNRGNKLKVSLIDPDKVRTFLSTHLAEKEAEEVEKKRLELVDQVLQSRGELLASEQYNGFADHPPFFAHNWHA